MNYTYPDILQADTPTEVTRASFWRVRSDYDADASWGLVVRRADLVGDPPPIRSDELPDEVRRYFSVETGELRRDPRYRTLRLNWRAPRARGIRPAPSDRGARGRPTSGSFHEVVPREPLPSSRTDEAAEARAFPPGDAWRSADACFLANVPRDVFVDLMRMLETPAALHSHSGADAGVWLLDATGRAGESMGRDRPGELKVHEGLQVYLRHLLELRLTEDLACYLAGTPEGWASKHAEREFPRDEMHRRVRQAVAGKG